MGIFMCFLAACIVDCHVLFSAIDDLRTYNNEQVQSIPGSNRYYYYLGKVDASNEFEKVIIDNAREEFTIKETNHGLDAGTNNIGS